MSPDGVDVVPAAPATPAHIAILERPPPRRFVDADVLARRMGRIAFALGFFAGPLFVAALHAGGFLHADHALPHLVAGWLTALAARAVVTALARGALSRGEGRTGDELLRPSLVLPAIALALVGPLSVHAPFALLVDGPRALDGWAYLSAVIVGHAHVVLAALAARRALRLVDGEPALAPQRIYWIVVAVSAVPGVVFLGLPPLLTALTGLAALPLLHGMEGVIAGERARLEE